MKNEFLCNNCGKTTPLVRKTDILDEGIRHEYAECQKCNDKVTIFYSDDELRRLMFKQIHTKTPAKKRKLAHEIENKMKDLNNLYGL